MKALKTSIYCLLILAMSCNTQPEELKVQIFETSASGNQLTQIEPLAVDEEVDLLPVIRILPDQKFQTITGFGGAFTEASAYLLNKLSQKNRDLILKAYFSEEGANYSLCRTHMNSCDFSLDHYSYTPTEDKELKDFSVKEDMDDLIPMIKDAQAISKDGFKLFASPWTAPPWMKDNKEWVGGKLLKEYYPTWALFFSKYIEAYKEQDIELWGFTVENEPHGNGNNWESMHFSPEEMTDFVQHHLGPKLEADGYGDKIILGYDQNRAGIKEWVDVMYATEESLKYYDGTAIHWYESTYEVFPDNLQYAHNKAPNKYLIETEGCIDAQVPVWKDDAWYWKKEATDWGWDWASAEEKYLHPKYAPANRYARDIIGCLNNWVDGWVDWNMVLNKQGGPNWFKNWCIAPVIVDELNDEVYFTPLYYIMTHFSKYIRPGAKVLGIDNVGSDIIATAAENPDGSTTLVVFNEGKEAKTFYLWLNDKRTTVRIKAQAIQTIVMQNN
ncbi:MAG: glycosyl hydrolase family 30 [Flavobacteriaceae bacterium]|nr:glycosyl hydrolase family 30 [Flavobacteriaceae bacterium]MBD10559.1 glycosyl hydrolase family 30 [Flavobacteriaceae bacterium]|tara:strand:+ start:44658 stop:46154 length:1497 start_codon:yes stop_codon:yes gene_type:complete